MTNSQDFINARSLPIGSSFNGMILDFIKELPMIVKLL